MSTFEKIARYVVVGLQGLIVFVVVFESRIDIPAVLASFGRMHPMLLHFPIALVFLMTLLVFAQKLLEPNPKLIGFLIILLALTTSLTALMGAFLSQEGGYDLTALSRHKWLGVGLSFMTWGLMLVPTQKLRKAILASACAALTIGAHFGAALTHGEDFVTAPLLEPPPKLRSLSDSTTVFAGVVEPILESKCYGCHNTSKSKGGLVLTSLASIGRGGKNGKVWVPGDAAHSLIVKRMLLPPEAKEHMPPRDKAQLSPDEIAFISTWIDEGANAGLRLSDLDSHDTLRTLSRTIIDRYYQQPHDVPVYHFASVSDELVTKLNIPNRAVFRIARHEPALGVDFFLAKSYSEKYLKELEAVAAQIVRINLSGMPVQDEELSIIATFSNLEKLVLNNTPVTGSSLGELTRLTHLKTVALSGSKVNVAGLARLGGIASMQRVFLWNTAVTDAEVKKLREEFPAVEWERGFVPDETERLKLNPPLFANNANVLGVGEKVLLKHNLPGTRVLVSLDGSDPDSVSGMPYRGPVDIPHFTVIRARAVKEGWLSSDIVEYVVYKKGLTPGKAILISAPESKYAGDGVTTITDGLKGMPDFYKDPSWVGFRTQPMIAGFGFDTPQNLSVITISYARNVWAMCMPPESVEVWAGPDSDHLKRVARIIPRQPDNWVSNRTEGVNIPLPPEPFAYYKVVAKPLSKLPPFRKERKESGWLMVDEVFFN